MKNVSITSSCKVLGRDRFPGEVVAVPEAVAANLLALNRAVAVSEEPAMETRDPEPEHRDLAAEAPRRGRPPKPQ